MESSARLGKRKGTLLPVDVSCLSVSWQGSLLVQNSVQVHLCEGHRMKRHPE